MTRVKNEVICINTPNIIYLHHYFCTAARKRIEPTRLQVNNHLS
jgi:hypothetical protein